MIYNMGYYNRPWKPNSQAILFTAQMCIAANVAPSPIVPSVDGAHGGRPSASGEPAGDNLFSQTDLNKQAPKTGLQNHGKLDAKTCWMHTWSSWWSGIPLASIRIQPDKLFSINWVNCSYTGLRFLLKTHTPRLCKLATQTAKQTCLKRGRNKCKTGVSQI